MTGIGFSVNVDWKNKTLVALVMLALVLTIVQSMTSIAATAMNTFTGSMITDSGEMLTIEVKSDSGKPSSPFHSLLTNPSWTNLRSWVMDWKVGGVEVTTTENALSITVTGANIQSTASVDYYIKAVSASDSQKWTKELNMTGASVTVGGAAHENSTGSLSIDTHLSNIGLATAQSQTIDYYIYLKATATGIISGESIVAEVAEIKFDTVTYEYVDTCFAGDTLVTMSDWSQKRIDEIRVGEQVKSYDLDNKTFINAFVTHVFHHASDEMGDYYLIVETDLGHVVKVTPNHIVYSNGEWVSAGELNFGDILFDDLGMNNTVTEIRRIYEQIPTFNLEVEGSHVFFAGNLVHNGGSKPASWYITPPLSLIAMPIGQQIIASIALVVVGVVVLGTLKRKKTKRKSTVASARKKKKKK